MNELYYMLRIQRKQFKKYNFLDFAIFTIFFIPLLPLLASRFWVWGRYGFFEDSASISERFKRTVLLHFGILVGSTCILNPYTLIISNRLLQKTKKWNGNILAIQNPIVNFLLSIKRFQREHSSSVYEIKLVIYFYRHVCKCALYSTEKMSFITRQKTLKIHCVDFDVP